MFNPISLSVHKATLPNGTAEERRQVEHWKKYIEWEKSNPMRSEDHQSICKRVMFAVEQALLILPHHPDIWLDEMGRNFGC